MIQLLSGPSLLGLGADTIDGFLLQHPKPGSTEVAEFLKIYAPAERASIAQQLVARGVSSNTVAAALNWLDASGKMKANWPTIAGILAIASASASAYHGYRRNQSIGWALWWFVAGSIFPVVTPVVAVAQGFGKKKA